MTSTPPVERDAVRALLLTPDEEVLLLQYLHPDRGETFWVTPGGGREPGEGVVDCLHRELLEETGWSPDEPGAHVWSRVHEFTWRGQRYLQRERFHLIRTARFAARSHRPDAQEAEFFRGFRWWRPEEIAGAGDERFAPVDLGSLLRRLIDDGAQGPPVEIPV